jgi:hypothetical protein
MTAEHMTARTLSSLVGALDKYFGQSTVKDGAAGGESAKGLF